MPFRKLVVMGLACTLTADAGAQNASGAPSARDVRTYGQLLAATDTRQLDTLLIDRGLASNWLPLRRAAALAIGQIGPERGAAGVSRLRSLLGDREISVAANAAYAIGLLRDSASVPALAGALIGDHELAREAAWALGEVGAPARSTITSTLNVAHPNDVTVQLLLAAAKLRPVPVADIRPLLRDRSPSVVWAASYAIARIRAPAGLSALMDLESSSALRATPPARGPVAEATGPYTNPQAAIARTRAEIARALTKSAAGDSLGEQAFAVLARLSADSEPHVRINALRSAATYGPRAKQLLVNGTRDADPNVRITAAQSFGTVLSRESTEFATLLAADTSLVYRASLLAAATRAGLRPPELELWKTSPDWRWRAAVASADGDTLDRPFAISRALPLTLDPDPRVRESAFAALVPAVSMSLEDSVHAVLLTGLRDPDFYVRATVLGALNDRPSAADLPAVMASYRQAARDSANDARLAAVQYVASLWKRDSTAFTPARRAELAQLPVPSDPLERAAGKTVPAWEKWQSVTPSARAISWYEELVRNFVMPVQSGKTINATINTVRGPIRLELFGAEAPITVWNFLSLARSGYYRNTRFHRVVPNFVAQDGDPRDDGNGGPGYAIRDEMNRHRYERGAVGMALSGPDTGGSQYFITHSPQPHLDGRYTVFARVVSGYEVLDRLVQGDLIRSIDPK